MTLLTPLAPQPTLSRLPQPLAGTAPLIEALYLHVPFCTHKCHYCDFYSLAGHLDRADDFLTALTREFDLALAHFGTPAPRTLFIGGGTPTLLSPDRLERLLKIITDRIDTSRLQEFTVEANPNTFDAQKARILAGGGVNRISFGAQSFIPSELATLQRDHDPASLAPAFAAARGVGITNLNLDLIFGIPGQTLASWEFSLARALELAPNHLSCYSLIYEPNTAMTARLRAGDFQKIDEDTELALFDHVYHRLSAAGFTRYETSNYARITPSDNTPGPALCHHNLIYWQAGNWLGLGPSAGSHMAKTEPEALARDGVGGMEPAAWQWKNAGTLAHYLSALHPGTTSQTPITQMEPLTRTHWAAGAAVFWLRLNAGLNYQEFTARTQTNPRPVLERVLAPFAQQGFIELTPESARITQRGVAVSDHILKRVLAALEA